MFFFVQRPQRMLGNGGARFRADAGDAPPSHADRVLDFINDHAHKIAEESQAHAARGSNYTTESRRSDALAMHEHHEDLDAHVKKFIAAAGSMEKASSRADIVAGLQWGAKKTTKVLQRIVANTPEGQRLPDKNAKSVHELAGRWAGNMEARDASTAAVTRVAYASDLAALASHEAHYGDGDHFEAADAHVLASKVYHAELSEKENAALSAAHLAYAADHQHLAGHGGAPANAGELSQRPFPIPDKIAVGVRDQTGKAYSAPVVAEVKARIAQQTANAIAGARAPKRSTTRRRRAARRRRRRRRWRNTTRTSAPATTTDGSRSTVSTVA